MANKTMRCVCVRYRGYLLSSLVISHYSPSMSIPTSSTPLLQESMVSVPGHTFLWRSGAIFGKESTSVECTNLRRKYVMTSSFTRDVSRSVRKFV